MSPPTLAVRYVSIGEAESARSALEAAGIEVMLVDDEMVALNWLYAEAVGGVKVLVPENDLEAARVVLESLSREPAAGEYIEEESAQLEATPVASEHHSYFRCPECGSDQVVAFPRLKIFVVLAIFAWGVTAAVNEPGLLMAIAGAVALILAFGPSRRCTACGERWSASKPFEEPREQPLPPDASDLVEELCPRCGSPEYYRISYRRLKAIPLLTSVAMLVVLPIYLFLPKRQCDSCGYKS